MKIAPVLMLLAVCATASFASESLPRPREVHVTYWSSPDPTGSPSRRDVSVRFIFDTGFDGPLVNASLSKVDRSASADTFEAVRYSPTIAFLTPPGGLRIFDGRILQAERGRWGDWLFQWEAKSYQLGETVSPDAPRSSLVIPIPEAAPASLSPEIQGIVPNSSTYGGFDVAFSPMVNAAPGSFITASDGFFTVHTLPPAATQAPLDPKIYQWGFFDYVVSHHYAVGESVVDGVTIKYFRGASTRFKPSHPGMGTSLNVDVFNAWPRRVNRGEVVEVTLQSSVTDPATGIVSYPKDVVFHLYRDGQELWRQTSATLAIETASAPGLGNYRITAESGGREIRVAEFALEVVGAVPGRSISIVRHPSPEPPFIPEPFTFPGAIVQPYIPPELILMADAIGPNGERFDPKTFVGVSPMTFRWYRNGQPTEFFGPARVFQTIQAEDVGLWTANITAGGVSAMTKGFEVRLDGAFPVPSVRLVNVSARAVPGSGEKAVVLGAITTGDARLLVRHVGPSLQQFGIENPLTDPALRLFRFNEPLDSNDDWQAASGVTPDLFESVGAFALPAGSKDAALVADVPSGGITAILEASANETALSLAEVYVVEGAPVRNLSVRGYLDSAQGPAILGFVLKGEGAKRYLIRVVGPGLVDYGLASALDPQLRLFTGDLLHGTNEQWETSSAATEIQAAVAQVGGVALRPGQGEAAILATLSEGAYTVMVDPQRATSGFFLAEVWELP